MTDFGINISKPGVGVGTATLPDLYLTSGKPVLKTFMVETSNYTFSSDISSATVTINHGLGYSPMAWFAIDGPGTIPFSQTTDYWLQYYNEPDDKALRYWSTNIGTGDAWIVYGESLVHGAGYDPTGEAWNFKVYIFYEKGG